MSDVFLYIYIIICLALVVWGVSRFIQIDKEYKRDMKCIDEWYQSELKWLEEQRRERECEEE